MDKRLYPSMLLAACTAGLPAAAHATITVYTTQASFAAATTARGADDFSGLSVMASTPSPLLRTAGSYSYTASTTNATTAAANFFAGGTTANPFLSTVRATDSVTFTSFSGGVSAIGGAFFGSNAAGNYAAGAVMVTVLDANGDAETRTISPTGINATSALGFVSTSPLVSLTVTSMPTSGNLWPGVDNLTLAISAVPEPATTALLLAGLGGLALLRARRR